MTSGEVLERDIMEFDVVIVGGGPAGLSAAIRLRQNAIKAQKDLSVCVIDKGSEIGAHILSGAVIETVALDELLPEWEAMGAPLDTPVSEDRFVFLTRTRAVPMPCPPYLHNSGNYVVSLGSFCRWLAEQAEGLDVDIFPGFAAAEAIYEDNRVVGVVTGDVGRDADGGQGVNFQPGAELRARTTLVAEGCRGSLSQSLIKHYKLDRNCQPQTYGLGVKELWDIDPIHHKPGMVMHVMGWPLFNNAYGGGFIYHLGNNQVALGLVTGLDYKNPYVSPFDEMQSLKTHPAIAPMLKGGKRVSYGARTITEGGYQSIPDLTFPGGALIGDSAGLVNVPKVKGTHTAMKSGMVAADAVWESLAVADSDAKGVRPRLYPARLQDSWVMSELKAVRNIRPGFALGLWFGMAYAALTTYVLKGREPWTLRHRPDHQCLRPAAEMPIIKYAKPDGVLTFDKPSSVYLANTTHDESQPVHLKLVNQESPVVHNLSIYDGPEERYCPAGVYEFERESQQLRINAANCVHCKACDIKDPLQNIRWSVPEGGSGPNYPNM